MRNKSTTGLVVQQQASNGSEQLLRLKLERTVLSAENYHPYTKQRNGGFYLITELET